MRRSLRWCLCLTILIQTTAFSQSKKPLDHSVYDGWQSIGVKTISNNGQWAAYTVTPQEGDGTLVVRNLHNGQEVSIPRGSAPVITEDSRYVIFYIKPFFQDTRQARIKKKLPADLPKDSLGILELGQTAVTKIAAVKSFKTPEKGSGLLAYLKDKPKDTSARIALAKPAPLKDAADADDDTPGKPGAADAGDLVIMYLGKQLADTVKSVTSYTISKPGNRIVLVTNPPKKDSLAKPAVLLWDVTARKSSILSNGHGTFAQFAFDEKGRQLAYLGSRDSAKALQKFYALYYFKPGQDSAQIAVTRSTQGIPAQWSVSEDGVLTFSRNGERLFFGTAPVPKPKDTTIVDFEVAKVDIWHYQDDYLQTMQLKNLDRELKRNYAAVYFPAQQRVVQLGDLSMENFIPGDEGNAPYGLGYTDTNNRVALQWTGSTLKTAYAVNIATGERKPVKTNVDGNFSISPEGRFILWFDQPEGQWHVYETATGSSRVISANIPARITDEEMDMPDYPRPYGTNGWQEHDRYVYINDRYDIWQVDPQGKEAPVNLTRGEGRRTRTSFRILKLDREERFMLPKQQLLLAAQNDSSKYGSLWSLKLQDKKGLQQLVSGPWSYSAVDKAKNAGMYLFQRSNFQESPDVFAGADIARATRISALNPQQRQYNWGTAELFKWNTYNGKTTEGILYKPEDFDPNKKYPVLIYFYEKLTDGLYTYQPPAPTPSRLNITFFVSRGYVVLAPDIRYETGHPGKSAYDYIVSGAEALAKNPWIDKANMGIQGQSWGGYQVCYLITATPLFKAAWAGAPVANMTSAYGGIRWESGMNRQFQYEHSQSRIGATLWEKPELYIENSPLFHIPKVTTPLAIMHNDADGAVPWYQGIEMFTAMRRLGKPVWLLNYNGEAHNLIQRQNRKDIQVREQQFFDHFLKGAPAPKWLSKGVPATEKGKDWGFDH
ncbi:prolyl oligopeptidase family serine peptidase [Chitinophaga sp. 22620]|uniref:S9 family peptidase n=1 Tax=Chitinophaga sp. 22620 TaxID=3453952 RepID=UPI003F874482